MLRAFIIILAVVAALISMSMLASRGGHESYDAEYFSPGPVIGILKGLSEDELEGREIGTPGAARAREMITARMSAMEMLSIGAGYEHPFSVPIIPRNQEEAAEERPPLEGVNLIGAVQGSAGSDRNLQWRRRQCLWRCNCSGACPTPFSITQPAEAHLPVRFP